MSKNHNLFHNASLRLTALYLLIIVFISLMFSVGIYRVSQQELERSIKRPISTREKRLFINSEILSLEDLLEEREQEFDEALDRLRSNLILLNILIIFAGGGVSYFLARRSLKPIEEAHEAQSRFTADASHELRTPITAMRTEIEISLTDKKLTLAKAKKQLESNLEELDKLTSLSEGLLQLSKLENSDLAKDKLQVSKVIRQSVDRVLKHAEAKKQIINTKGVKDAEVSANQTALVEAIVTLLDNAIKYSPQKSEITIATKSQSKSIDISVSDKGPGIKSTDLPHIFDRFYQADSSRTDSGKSGYGIGLSIAKSIVESHGGSISANSKPGKGSKLTITLPA